MKVCRKIRVLLKFWGLTVVINDGREYGFLFSLFFFLRRYDLIFGGERVFSFFLLEKFFFFKRRKCFLGCKL